MEIFGAMQISAHAASFALEKPFAEQNL